MGGNVALVDLATAQEVFHKSGRLDRIDLIVAPSERDRVRRELERALPAEVTVDLPQSRTRQVENMVHAFELNLTALSFIALFVSMFLIFNAVAMSVLRAVGLLLAGALSALVVVADQIVSTWDDGQLLLAWVALWSVLFAALALSAELVFGWYAQLQSAWGHWSAAAAQRASDAQTWQIAQTDRRFMAELQAARYRAEALAEEAGEPVPAWPFATMPAYHPARRNWP